MKLKIITMFLKTALIIWLTFGCGQDSKTYFNVEIRQKIVVNDELRLIVETSKSYRPAYSHSSKTYDEKGYYLTLDLSKLDSKNKFYGPMWDIPNERSSISYNTGINFTKKDYEAAVAKPSLMFNTDGSLYRFRFDAIAKKPIRDIFFTSAVDASWKDSVSVNSYSNNVSGSEEEVYSLSGRYVVIYEKGISKLYDNFTGNEQKDEWLTSVFTQKCSIHAFGNVRLFLTDDLNHFVASPHCIWNTSQFDHLITTFEIEGKVYDRKMYGIYYSRPSLKPTVFIRDEKDANFLAEAPLEIFSISGELYFLMIYDESIKLFKPNGEQKIVASIKRKSRFGVTTYNDIQHAEKTNEIIIFENNYDDSAHSDLLYVTRWNYKSNEINVNSFNIEKLLKEETNFLKIK